MTLLVAQTRLRRMIRCLMYEYDELWKGVEISSFGLIQDITQSSNAEVNTV
jgi:hypothetical protein